MSPVTTNKTLLIKCRRCEANIAPDAATCPQCGDPQPIGDAQTRLTCDACNTPNIMSLEVCRGCGKSLKEEMDLRCARMDNEKAREMRSQFTFWGVVGGMCFPGIPLAYSCFNPDTTGGLIGGMILIALSATGVAYIGRNLARQMYPYRHTPNMPEYEKQSYAD
ncbi:MAG: zinc ribbon domain-containing protein [Gemmataceae bacterium]